MNSQPSGTMIKINKVQDKSDERNSKDTPLLKEFI